MKSKTSNKFKNEMSSVNILKSMKYFHSLFFLLLLLLQIKTNKKREVCRLHEQKSLFLWKYLNCLHNFILFFISKDLCVGEQKMRRHSNIININQHILHEIQGVNILLRIENSRLYYYKCRAIHPADSDIKCVGCIIFLIWPGNANLKNFRRYKEIQ